jgi:hypothetical protein
MFYIFFSALSKYWESAILFLPRRLASYFWGTDSSSRLGWTNFGDLLGVPGTGDLFPDVPLLGDLLLRAARLNVADA